MSAALAAGSAERFEAAPGTRSFSPRKLQNGLLWLLIFSSFFVFFEPAPYEIVFVLTAIAFALTEFRIARSAALLIVPLMLYNLGGAFALFPFIMEKEPVFYIGITFYMSVTAVFFAGVFLTDTKRRFEIVSQAWTLAAVIASTCGMMGYFDVAGSAEIFTLYGRATGTFKDPNVLGPFLCGPAILLTEGFFTGRLKRPVLSLAALLIILGGIFFSFSRGAWGVTILSAALCGVLVILTTHSPRIRLRVILVGCAGLALIAMLLAVILSVDSIREFFFERFVLLQEYDEGPRGRFGKLANAISLLLERPNGIGPLHFTDFFPEAPHNAYVNAFSSYGWLGGLAYIAFIAATFRMGWTAVWKRTPWQSYYIAIWSFTFIQYIQGLQIDTDHWRHLWMVVGATWGAGAASLRHADEQALAAS
ncbi:MAG: O-antigen ligase domain-containing protein [Beijerinckiaceae bacterium]|nr:O-antigen ligase domain-containing protein [Beijerinckiaceae bacterium]